VIKGDNKMLDKTTIVKVTNRDNGNVGYVIPDLGNLRRSFQPNETKELTVEEIRKLSYIRGGNYILKNCLLIDNQELIDELFSSVEPEYYYTEEDVKKLLLEGTLDQLMDCLDFAPNGVIELIKDLAVKLEINDISKRNAIFEKTGLNINSAIDFNKESKEETAEEKAKTRRAEPVTSATETKEPVRRTTPKYKVVQK
jgi:hypothetical protein